MGECCSNPKPASPSDELVLIESKSGSRVMAKSVEVHELKDYYRGMIVRSAPSHLISPHTKEGNVTKEDSSV